MFNVLKTRISKTIRLLFANTLYRRAYRKYVSTGNIPSSAEGLLHYSTWKSSGIFPRQYSLKFAKPDFDNLIAPSKNRYFNALDPKLAASEVEKNGFYLVPKLLPDQIVNTLLAHLEDGPTHPRGMEVSDFSPGKPNPSSPSWWMRTDQIIKSQEVQELLLEDNLIRTAALYLKSRPRIMSLAMWKSYSGFGTDANASQKYHFDNDRANFLKLFIYLTDVTEQNGPHTYVKGSHNQKPKKLLHGEKLEDFEIERHYRGNVETVITGLKGQAFFADTAAFHKGTKVIAGTRAIFQINYATDNFGAINKDVAVKIGETLFEINNVDPHYLESILERASKM